MKAQPEEQAAALSSLVRQMLHHLGEDAQRSGLERTPERVAASLQFLTQGYQLDLDSVINGALFEAEHDEMVIVKDIEVYSLCEHHLLPFYGKCHLAYLPDRKIIGLSKMARIVDVFSRRLQIQERLTTEIASTVKKYLEPKGVGVVIEAHHFCMMMRGVQKQNSRTVTSCMLGRFKSDSKTRSEFLEFLK
ncbi:MAG: GTP cyclohydrolase I FolE [Acidobacteriota bacterium]|nr:GTP cyclohydrolase I FolE [Acidobacteriota bacterium]MDE2962482.1 GTP cyclohydrolase I FolE [Acidobacteriota bacterium]